MFENTSLFSILLFKKGRKELSLLKKQNRLALDLRDMFQQSEDILKEEESELVMGSVKTETQTEKWKSQSKSDKSCHNLFSHSPIDPPHCQILKESSKFSPPQTKRPGCNFVITCNNKTVLVPNQSCF